MALKSPQPTRYHIPETEIQAMLEQRRAGVSNYQIARDFHRCTNRVRTILSEHDIQFTGLIPMERVAELFHVPIRSISHSRFRQKWGLGRISRMRLRTGYLWDEAQVLECVKQREAHQLNEQRERTPLACNTNQNRKKHSRAVEQRIIRHFRRDGTATRLELDLALNVSQVSLSAALESLDTQGLIVRSDHDCTVWKLSRKALEGEL